VVFALGAISQAIVGNRIGDAYPHIPAIIGCRKDTQQPNNPQQSTPSVVAFGVYYHVLPPLAPIVVAQQGE